MRFPFGIWNLAPGICSVCAYRFSFFEIGNLVLGICFWFWNLEFGAWNLTFRIESKSIKQ
ncbi:hypothetical protein DHB64_17820 [Antarcticibacterium sp. W02-3]|nr:hypothetical protein [Antarcticibacterium sp. W02-3]